MTEEPDDDFDYGDKLEDGQYENHPTIDEGEFVQPVRTSYEHVDRCGEVTTMKWDLAKSLARDPGNYSKTFCCECQGYFDLSEFVWEGTEKRINKIHNSSED